MDLVVKVRVEEAEQIDLVVKVRVEEAEQMDLVVKVRVEEAEQTVSSIICYHIQALKEIGDENNRLD